MVGFFRMLGYFEAISFIVLLAIAMPLKYFAGMPEAVRMVGMTHGMLFMAYVLFATYLAFALEWPKRLLVQSYVAAVVPFGTIYFDRKHLREA